MNGLRDNRERGIGLKVVILWMAILLLGSFWLTVRGTSDPISMAVLPQVPRAGEPIIVTFRLNNPSSEVLVTKYQFYTNGELLKEGVATIAPASDKIYKYAYENSLPIGERLNFVVRTESARGAFEKFVSTPPYPPQVWSSFVSFASFSTSVMSFMSTMTYYESTFGNDNAFNLGLLYTIILAVLLIFLELSQPLLRQNSITILGRLRIRFSTVTWILFIIFVGIVYTKVVMILTL